MEETGIEPMTAGLHTGRFTARTILPDAMVAAAGFDTRSLQVLSNQCPGGPLPDKGSELDKGIPLLLPLLGLRCVNFRVMPKS